MITGKIACIGLVPGEGVDARTGTGADVRTGTEADTRTGTGREAGPSTASFRTWRTSARQSPSGPWLAGLLLTGLALCPCTAAQAAAAPQDPATRSHTAGSQTAHGNGAGNGAGDRVGDSGHAARDHRSRRSDGRKGGGPEHEGREGVGPGSRPGPYLVPSPVPHPDPVPNPIPGPSLAGSSAGEGRDRPGRRVPAADDESPSADTGTSAQAAPAAPVDPNAPTAPAASAAPAVPPPTARATQAADPPADPAASPAMSPAAVGPSADGGANAQSGRPVVRYVSLGTGLILVGLGLGMAFVALRLRHD